MRSESAGAEPARLPFSLDSGFRCARYFIPTRGCSRIALVGLGWGVALASTGVAARPAARSSRDTQKQIPITYHLTICGLSVATSLLKSAGAGCSDWDLAAGFASPAARRT